MTSVPGQHATYPERASGGRCYLTSRPQPNLKDRGRLPPLELERRLSSGKWNFYVDLAFAVAAKSKK